MRYAKGSLNLANFRDDSILHFVAESRYVTHSQLFEFAQLYYGEDNRPVFNWRIRRMVEGGLARKRALPLLAGDALYSITRSGIYALERGGTFYLGANLDRDDERRAYQVPHALEINNIRLALLRSGRLLHWIPESFIRVVNLSPAYGYAKVYDGIADLREGLGGVQVAIEYERTLKSPAKYEKIREAIESEKRIKVFLYLVPRYEVLWALEDAFRRTKQCILLALVDPFKKDPLGARVRHMRFHEQPLQDVLAAFARLKTGT
jgi:hypothetical protein